MHSPVSSSPFYLIHNQQSALFTVPNDPIQQSVCVVYVHRHHIAPVSFLSRFDKTFAVALDIESFR